MSAAVLPIPGRTCEYVSMWVRGEARIDGDDIVLYGGTAERYAIRRLEHGASLLIDLGGLSKLGEMVDGVQDSKTRLIDAVRLKDT